MGPHLDFYLSPLQVDIWVMPFVLGEFADFVGEFQRVAEVLERVRSSGKIRNSLTYSNGNL